MILRHSNNNSHHDLTFTDICTPIDENDSCYVVNSSIFVIHHPFLFTEESVSLVVTDSSNSYFNESERIRYNAHELGEVFAVITVTLVGVEISE